ncbi:MAG: succinate--CoA ligase subunit alpha [Deltaproteobacteria bacterium]|nr:succinate--CoA ligase subunit alpha [Deltaproteobacteria bacterium]MBW1738143.1 succinate--CoA ligase subunit alpha [Deltaproteobacteria bacterium]MBW1910917.1 succinate--CoA ligase subunit alpha [Deltaproteobacteria bacterium]MBW2035350.1 succinate--CoA ligase subunit alpha [Deltaproteobacteria bacterium]MBW2115394.1 succinate--CoA ligase subunit alpha [Deltaproteobacteria bacterium]
MSILVDENTRVVVQGITGREGAFHTKQMLNYGTVVAAGVTPGKGGKQVKGVPVFNTVYEAVEKESANVSCIFVPPPSAGDAIMEAASAGLGVIVCITEGIPILDMVKVASFLKDKNSVLIGPNCPGIISPGKTKVGIMPGPIHKPGGMAVISRSGTLTYEVVDQLTRAGLGQSTCIGIGGDPIIGTTFIDHLKRFKDDPETKGVVLIGEIGGTTEEEAAEYIRKEFDKPVIAFIAGQTAPPGRRMGHAGAIISGGEGKAENKIKALEDAGITVALDLGSLGKTASKIMGKS